MLISGRPRSDESFLGYVLRLTELNGYESISWIFQAANLNYEKSCAGKVFAFNPPNSLARLAEIAGINPAELFRLTYRRVTKPQGVHSYNFFGQAIPQYALRLSKPKVCPDCLSEYPYCRRVWELSAVTACLKHQCLLIDECPNCGKHLPWPRNKVLVCTCKYDWRCSPRTAVSEQQLKLTRQIYRLCALPSDASKSNSFPESVSGLTLDALLLVLFFIAGQSKGVSSTTNSHLVSAGGNQSFHDVLNIAYSVFENWPSNYFEFLNRRRAHEKNVRRTYQRIASSFYREFGSFYSGLYKVLSGNQFDFMRSAFIDYSNQVRMLEYLPSSVSNEETGDPLKSQYISKSDVRRLLGVDNRWINHRIEMSKLKTITRSKGKKRLIFIRVEDFIRLTSET